MRLKKAAAVLLLAAAAGSLSACGPAGSDSGYYAPMTAYGQAGQCYYVYDPGEVVSLQLAGLCPMTWRAQRAPVSWLEEYWYYYDSALYYNSYVPARYRTVYVHTYMPREYGIYHSQISVASRRAVYRTSTGSTVTGITSTSRFGSGSSFGTGQRYGGGNLRARTGTSSSSRTGTSSSSTSGKNLRQSSSSSSRSSSRSSSSTSRSSGHH